MKPAGLWRHPLPQSVFRLMAGPAGLLALEFRDAVQQTVSFQVLQMGVGVLGTNIRVPDQPWLVHLANISPDALWLHGYSNPQLPQPSGLYCLHLNGELRWHAPNYRLLHNDGHQVVVAERITESDFRYHRLDKTLGHIVGSISQQEAEALPTSAEVLQQPVLLLPDDPAYVQVATRLQQRVGVIPEGPISLLQAAGVTYAAGMAAAAGWLVAVAGQQLRWRLDVPAQAKPVAFALAADWLLVLPENPELVAVPHPPQ